jgi:hypothetical protein
MRDHFFVIMEKGLKRGKAREMKKIGWIQPSRVEFEKFFHVGDEGERDWGGCQVSDW